MAFTSADESVPGAVREALQDAMEVATENVPAVPGQVFICPDVSGSMQSPVTGHRETREILRRTIASITLRDTVATHLGVVGIE